MPNDNAQFGQIRANHVTNQDLADAGIPGIVISDEGESVIRLDPSATNEQFAAAAILAGQALELLAEPYVTAERLELTDAWLALKASLDAIPAVPGEGDDPYAEVRARVAIKVQLALDAVTLAGGFG